MFSSCANLTCNRHLRKILSFQKKPQHTSGPLINLYTHIGDKADLSNIPTRLRDNPSYNTSHTKNGPHTFPDVSQLSYLDHSSIEIILRSIPTTQRFTQFLPPHFLIHTQHCTQTNYWVIKQPPWLIANQLHITCLETHRRTLNHGTLEQLWGLIVGSNTSPRKITHFCLTPRITTTKRFNIVGPISTNYQEKHHRGHQLRPTTPGFMAACFRTNHKANPLISWTHHYHKQHRLTSHNTPCTVGTIPSTRLGNRSERQL